MTPETLTTRLFTAGLMGNPEILMKALVDAWHAGQMVALDVPAGGEPALIWADEADIFDNTGIWTSVEAEKWQTSSPYIAVSAARSALLAAEAKGLMEAAGFADEYVKTLLDGAAILKNNRNGGMATKLIEASTGYAELARRIRAAAAKLESGQ